MEKGIVTMMMSEKATYVVQGQIITINVVFANKSSFGLLFFAAFVV